ncbi:DUF1127 domain-containing protein [Pseudosulfitobacter pseudonitzschiae]|uniref:DUF1127 domain-containing protein n=1 Tax=Pseudosulfitobacter pseudonitzschiae TaxID=1402135 RepID=UPI001583C09A|nr:DUF1127 domain-containing protein [Pseudosulfitobacter pseudonitzschiae]
MAYITRNPAGSTPVRGSTFARYIIWPRQRLVEFVNRHRMRASVGSLSDRELRDIGLTHGDVSRSLDAPISVDASEVMQNSRRNRARNW